MGLTDEEKMSTATDRAPSSIRDEGCANPNLTPAMNAASLDSRDSTHDAGDHNSVRPGESARAFAILIGFHNLPASGKVEVLTYSFSCCSWMIKDPMSGAVRMLLEAPQNQMLPIRNFVINRRKLFFDVVDVCEELRLLLYLSASQNLLQGFVDLPAGSWMSLESDDDRTNVIGRGSFALMLGGRS